MRATRRRGQLQHLPVVCVGEIRERAPEKSSERRSDGQEKKNVIASKGRFFLNSKVCRRASRL